MDKKQKRRQTILQSKKDKNILYIKMGWAKKNGKNQRFKTRDSVGNLLTGRREIRGGLARKRGDMSVCFILR